MPLSITRGRWRAEGVANIRNTCLRSDCSRRGDVTDSPSAHVHPGLPVTLAVRSGPSSWPWPGSPGLVVSEAPLVPSGPAQLGRSWLVVALWSLLVRPG